MGTEVQFDGMRIATQGMLEAGEQMITTLSALRSDVEATQSAWQGAAQNAFIKVMAEWDQNTTTLNRTLGEIAELLGINNKDYQATEVSAESSIAAVGSVLTV